MLGVEPITLARVSRVPVTRRTGTIPVDDLTREVAVPGRYVRVGVADVDERFGGGRCPTDSTDASRFPIFMADPVVEVPLSMLIRLLLPNPGKFSPLLDPDSEAVREGGRADAGVPSKREEESRRWRFFRVDDDDDDDDGTDVLELVLIPVLRLY